MAKGGTTSSNTQIPAYLEDAVRENINRARDVSQIGYTPYYGADVAAFSPMQQQSMRSTGNAASAFGLAPQGFDAMAGMPQAQTFAGGVQGYSSAPLYEQSLDNLFAKSPAQYNAMSDMFIDPFTGARSRNNYGNASPVMGMARSDGGNGNSPYGNDANIDHLNRMKEQGTADVYDSIYRQNMSGDLVSGDTFVGDDGLNYTVGYDVGQVDPGLANAVQRNKINEVRSNSSAIGSMIGNTLQGGLLGRGIEALTGVAPFNSNDAPVGSLSNADINDGRFGGITGYEQIDAYNQRGDMYPSQIEGGLLNGTPLASNNIVDLSAARQAEDLAAQQRAAQRVAEERAQSALAVQYANEQAAAAQRMAAEKAAQLAHEQAMIAAQRSTVNSGGGGNPNKGNNSSGGYGKSKAPGEAGSRFGL